MIWLALVLAQQIMRPVDRAIVPAGALEIIAKAPAGARIEVNGRAIEVAAPYPGVLIAKSTIEAGRHQIALVWPDGRQAITVATEPQDGFRAYRPHPPGGATACTACHGVSAKGRFRFQGGCFACHASAAFAKKHTHDENRLADCGLCHNAHGSNAVAHLLRPREAACQICHQ
jgi:predicted CXXCH cytochrome family protein